MRRPVTLLARRWDGGGPIDIHDNFIRGTQSIDPAQGGESCS
jgi:hypothetical protein